MKTIQNLNGHKNQPSTALNKINMAGWYASMIASGSAPKRSYITNIITLRKGSNSF